MLAMPILQLYVWLLLSDDLSPSHLNYCSENVHMIGAPKKQEV